MTTVCAQSSVKGYIIASSGEAIPYAHVVNTSRQGVVTSQPNGFFKIEAATQDTLRFTMVGYQPYQLIIQSEHVEREQKIMLVEDSVLLPGITIIDRPMEPVMKVPEREPMKVNSVRSREEIVPKKTIRFDMGNPANIEQGVPTVGVGGTFTGVLTHLYDLVSKDGKERRAYAKSREQSMEEAAYTELITAPATADTLQTQYQLTHSEYERLLARFNQQYPDARKLPTKSEIWGLLHYFFSQQMP